MKKETLFSVPEAAKFIGVSSHTIYQWLNKGKLAGYKIGGSRWRISEKHINDFYKHHEVKEED